MTPSKSIWRHVWLFSMFSYHQQDVIPQIKGAVSLVIEDGHLNHLNACVCTWWRYTSLCDDPPSQKKVHININQLIGPNDVKRWQKRL